jgi:hypothetical protein
VTRGGTARGGEARRPGRASVPSSAAPPCGFPSTAAGRRVKQG